MKIKYRFGKGDAAMTTTTTNTELMKSLAVLEKCLETPLVPGDLEAWAENARTSLQDVDRHVRNVIRNEHASVLKQIESEDAELQGRVDELRAGDQACLDELQTLTRTFASLDELAAAIEPDETKLKEQLDELVKQGLAFVIQVRTQVVSVRTWLQEAFDRDRGTVD
jgi:hypothetical protein